MADEKAPNAGVPTKKDRQAIASHSLLVIVKVKYEDWREERASKRRQAEAAKARAVLFPKAPSKPKADSKPKAQILPVVPPDPKKGRKGDRLAKALIAALLLLMALLALLAWVWFLNHRPSIEATSLPLVGSSTPTAMVSVVPAAVATDPVSSSEDVYLRVETLQLDTAYNIWRRMPGVEVVLAPVSEDGEEETRQVTEELLTTDGFLVAATTFEVQPGLYWVWVDETSLPAGCAVWVPRFAEDADSGISGIGDVIVNLVDYGLFKFNTMVVKFQIICGQEVSVSPTLVVPVSTPVPTNPPGPTPVPTTPVPPTDPPPPTPEPTEVDCNCETPESPVPTAEFEATPTPER